VLLNIVVKSVFKNLLLFSKYCRPLNWPTKVCHLIFQFRASCFEFSNAIQLPPRELHGEHLCKFWAKLLQRQRRKRRPFEFILIRPRIFVSHYPDLILHISCLLLTIFITSTKDLGTTNIKFAIFIFTGEVLRHKFSLKSLI